MVKRKATDRKPAEWPDDLAYPADKHGVKAALHRRGLTLNGLSVRAGFHISACRVGLHNGSCKAGLRLIAEGLGLKPEDLFDEDFWARGRPEEQKRRAA